jgi:hypothetical protein
MVMYLLMHCTSVKTVRLCLTLARELSLPWGASSTLTGCRREARGPGYRSPGRLAGAQALNQLYLDTARLLTQVAPLVFAE